MTSRFDSAACNATAIETQHAKNTSIRLPEMKPMLGNRYRAEVNLATQKRRKFNFALTLFKQTATNAETQVLRKVPRWASRPIVHCENLRLFFKTVSASDGKHLYTLLSAPNFSRSTQNERNYENHNSRTS